jgi:hypothetical protein
MHILLVCVSVVYVATGLVFESPAPWPYKPFHKFFVMPLCMIILIGIAVLDSCAYKLTGKRGVFWKI